MSEYTGENIQVLDDIQHVRERFGMYIGDNDVKGLHHLIWECVDNSIDEIGAGYGDQIKVEVHEDNSVTVEDRGRGIPFDKKEDGRSSLEVVMTVLHAGGKFDSKAYKMSGGLHGVGVSVVNALSEWCEVQVCRDGKQAVQKYEKGVPVSDIKVKNKDYEHTGTRITFKPDEEIFQTTSFQKSIIEERLTELSFLLPNINMVFIDNRNEYENEIISENGLIDYVDDITDELFMDNTFYMNKSWNDYEIELAFNYEDENRSKKILGYANNIKTEGGGKHISGFKNALTRAVKQATDEDRFKGQDLREGLRAVLSIMVPEPQFEGQTKAKLGNKEAHTAVTKTAYDEIIKYLNKNPKLAKQISKRAKKSAEARKAAKQAREIARDSDDDISMSLSSKLTDCNSRSNESTELFLVEGDSAGGSAKQARDKKYQAVLPLKGKIKNVEKSSPKTYLKNDEIQAMITAIGTGVNDDFDIEKLRYGRIICMSDPDVDGLHIQSLLATFFYRCMPELIEKGVIYMADPPLYYRKTKNGMEYLYGEGHDLDEGDVRLFKGLGEMNPEELWETTMNPETRRLIQLHATDKKETDEMVSTCMGRKVKPRRQLIHSKAKKEGVWND